LIELNFLRLNVILDQFFKPQNDFISAVLKQCLRAFRLFYRLLNPYSDLFSVTQYVLNNFNRDKKHLNMQFISARAVDYVVKPARTGLHVLHTRVNLDFYDNLRALFKSGDRFWVSDFLGLGREHAVEMIKMLHTFLKFFLVTTVGKESKKFLDQF
jgi:hypothetical protein